MKILFRLLIAFFLMFFITLSLGVFFNETSEKMLMFRDFEYGLGDSISYFEGIMREVSLMPYDDSFEVFEVRKQNIESMRDSLLSNLENKPDVKEFVLEFRELWQWYELFNQRVDKLYDLHHGILEQKRLIYEKESNGGNVEVINSLNLDLNIKLDEEKKSMNELHEIMHVLDKNKLSIRQKMETDTLKGISFLRRLIVIIVLFGSLMSLFLMVFLSFSISRPINSIVDIIEKISKGELNLKVDEKTKSKNDEIGTLAKAVDRILVSLKLVIMKQKEKPDFKNLKL